MTNTRHTRDMFPKSNVWENNPPRWALVFLLIAPVVVLILINVTDWLVWRFSCPQSTFTFGHFGDPTFGLLAILLLLVCPIVAGIGWATGSARLQLPKTRRNLSTTATTAGLMFFAAAAFCANDAWSYFCVGPEGVTLRGGLIDSTRSYKWKEVSRIAVSCAKVLTGATTRGSAYRQYSTLSYRLILSDGLVVQLASQASAEDRLWTRYDDLKRAFRSAGLPIDYRDIELCEKRWRLLLAVQKH